MGFFRSGHTQNVKVNLFQSTSTVFHSVDTAQENFTITVPNWRKYRKLELIVVAASMISEPDASKGVYPLYFDVDNVIKYRHVEASVSSNSNVCLSASSYKPNNTNQLQLYTRSSLSAIVYLYQINGII